MKIVLFGGTTEGRELSRRLAEAGAAVTVCVATEYGGETQPEGEHLAVRIGPMTAAEKQALLERILFRFDAALESRGKKYLLMNIPTDRLQEAFSLLQAMRSPTVMPLAIPGWSSVHSVVEEASLWQTVERLKAIGAEGILVLNVDKIID